MKSSFNKISLSILAAFISVVALAQEKGLDVDIDVNKGGEWYSQTWVWIVGGAVFLLLLVALLRGGGSKS